MNANGTPHTHSAHAQTAPRTPRPDAVAAGSVTRVHTPKPTTAQSFGDRPQRRDDRKPEQKGGK